jgi:hypothetical protein
MAGNISTETNTNDLYKYTASMTLVFDEKNPIELGMLYIKGIVVDYNYELNNFPIIYVTLALDNNLRDKMSENQENGSVIFKLQKYITNNDNPDLKITCFEGKFIYIMPSSVSDKSEEEEVENIEEREDIVKTFTIGLAKVDHVNSSKKAFNNVIRNGTVSSTINYFLKDHQVLMEPITNNKSISYIILPPLSSISKALNYLNSLYAFYSTKYRFFMDFDVTYLLSSSSKITKRKGEKYSDIMINIRRDYDEANLEGMITDSKGKRYVLNVSSSYCTFSDANMSNKSYSQYAATTTEGGVSTISVADHSGSELVDKKTYVRLSNNNTSYLANMKSQAKLHNVSIAVSTTKVDSTIFTLNKNYHLTMNETFGSEYNGQYLLASRRDVYSPEGEGFNLNITLTFNKIPT